MKKKVFITGGSGLLGQYINTELAGEYDILTQYHTHPGNCLQFPYISGNISDKNFLESAFFSFRPDIVIHTAAISNPQRALAADAEQVYAVNVDTTARLAELCKETGAALVYTSTDLVYAGYRGSLLKESAKLAPKSLYAETKLMGEVKIQRICPRYLILRTALLIGSGLHHTSCSFEQMVRTLLRGEDVTVFTDQYRSPFVLPQAASAIGHLIASPIENTILNFGGDVRLSRAELGEMVCEILRIPKTKLIKTTMDTQAEITPVEDVSLDVTLLKQKGFEYASFEEQLIKSVLTIKQKAGL